MNKFFLVFFVCAFSLTALACGGDGSKDGDKEERSSKATQSI